MPRKFISQAASVIGFLLCASLATAQPIGNPRTTELFGPILIDTEEDIHPDYVTNLLVIELQDLVDKAVMGRPPIKIAPRKWGDSGSKLFYSAKLLEARVNVVIKPEFPDFVPVPDAVLEFPLKWHMGEYLHPLHLTRRDDPSQNVMLVATSANPPIKEVHEALQTVRQLAISDPNRAHFHGLNLLLRHAIRLEGEIPLGAVDFIEFIDFDKGFSSLSSWDRYFILHELALALKTAPNPDQAVDRTLTMFDLTQRAFEKAVEAAGALPQSLSRNQFKRLVTTHQAKYQYECSNDSPFDCAKTIVDFLRQYSMADRSTVHAFLTELLTAIERETGIERDTGYPQPIEIYFENVRAKPRHFELWLSYFCLMQQDEKIRERAFANARLDNSVRLAKDLVNSTGVDLSACESTSADVVTTSAIGDRS